MIKTLGKLMGGENRVKVMRLFLMNKETPFDTKEASQRLKVKEPEVRKELSTLLGIGFLRKRKYTKDITVRGKLKKKVADGFVLREDFPFIKEISALLVESSILDENTMAERFKSTGKVKFVAVSGVLIGEDKARMDCLFVIDNINESKFAKAIFDLEAEIGKELTYAVFDSNEFKYRREMFDKLVWDMFDFPHRILLDKNQLSTMFVGRGR